MKIWKTMAWAGLILMSGMLIYGFLYGSFGDEGRLLMDMAWGRVTLVDIYVSFIVFLSWVWYREGALVSRLGWTCMVLVLGSFSICLYVLVALYRCEGKPELFFLGPARCRGSDAGRS